MMAFRFQFRGLTRVLSASIIAFCVVSAGLADEQDMSIVNELPVQYEQTSLTNVLFDVGERFDVLIEWLGEMPIQDVGVSVNATSADEAIDVILKAYGVNNYAINRGVSELGHDVIRVFRVGGSSRRAREYGSKAEEVITEVDETPLRYEQKKALIEADRNYNFIKSINDQPLSSMQTEMIRQIEGKRKIEKERGGGALDDEQLEIVRAQSYWIKLEEEQDSALDARQLERLRSGSKKIQIEMKESSTPLTEEQIRQLKHSDGAHQNVQRVTD